MSKFNLDLSIISFMGGHSAKRTHRCKEKFPGMTITMALIEALEEMCKKYPDRAKILTKTTVVDLLTKDKEVVGVIYEDKSGNKIEEYGPVVLCTGG